MSKNITIQKNGVAQSLFGVEEIKTNLYGTGTVEWVPEDEVTLQALSVTENGTYTPGEGVFGFSIVTVNVSASQVIGTMNGKTYVVTVDENGYLVYTEVTT